MITIIKKTDRKTALITGLRGQDGTYLAEYLLAQGYRVVGTSHTKECLDSLHGICPEVVKLDMGNYSEIRRFMQKFRPNELYNLAARSSSKQLFDDPVETAKINGLSPVFFLEAIRETSPYTRFCQAASSELFAGCQLTPQDESTPYYPINAYGAAKAFAANMVSAYRIRYRIFATTAILFNHESPRRGLEYVTRKISRTVAKIAKGQEKFLKLGNLDSRRDWGFAGDYTRAMWLMLQQPSAEDFVIATGITHSVREFCEVAFSHVGLDYKEFVVVDPKWARRSDSIELRGNPAKAFQRLNWHPTISFSELVCMMVDADLLQLSSSLNQT